jgi:acylphosphatase
MSERVRLQPDGTVEVLGGGRDEVMARMAAFKSEGSSKTTSGRNDFSGQFSTYQKSGVLVDKLPK